MQQLQVVEHRDMRVLTTSQLAEAFDTNNKIITRNFQRNQKHYIPEEHYFALSGEALRQFKAERQNDATLKYVSVLYLWTEKGAWLHAKSLNSDRSWEAFHSLVDNYYNLATKWIAQQKERETKVISYKQVTQIESRLDLLEMQMKEQITLHSGEQKRLRNAVSERVYHLAKHEGGARPLLFRLLYRALREHFDVESYRDVRQHELQDALHFVSVWGTEIDSDRRSIS